MIGLDVGSTTVKAVVIDIVTDEILWKDYQRHDTKQPEKVLEFLYEIEKSFPDVPQNAYRMFITGSGGSALLSRIGGKFVQEVNAVSLTVEKLYPEVQSVIELGGQDAKIIIFKEDPETGKKKKIPSMNDKCAGGTGAVIDKINAKLQIPTEELCEMGYNDIRLHPVAGKCGVFAETDINGLQKQGVPPDELMASLFESIIQQNMAVLTRGHTLRPTVLLLGGPNCYIKGMRDCWKHNIPEMWKERGVKLPDPNKKPEDYIITPENAQYFAAIGVIEFAKSTSFDGDTISKDPVMRQKIADVYVRYRVARALNYRLASVVAKGDDPGPGESSLTRIHNILMTQRAANLGVEALDLYGLIQDEAIAPFRGMIEDDWRKSISATIAAGTLEVQKEQVSVRGLGLPR
ncbi:MAG: hypothetical protein IIC20_08205 [Chloroflexi bacterium]|nr:hypothetical protein [Chloroflexota bacterium]